MIFPPFITDCHTHRPDARGAIINAVTGDDASMRPDLYYSVGIHPWDTLTATGADWEWVTRQAALPNVLAIGETGLDPMRGAPLDLQEQWLRRHIGLSEATGKPLILHVVRRADDILRLHRELRPRQPWIWHGFRGNAVQARQLTDNGLYLSLGKRFNPDVPLVVDPSRLLAETD